MLNRHFLALKENYLFSEVAKRTEEYRLSHPNTPPVCLSIGDVTRPLAPAVIQAMHRAVDDLSREESFRGYPPSRGYDFLLDKIRGYYAERGVAVDKDEIFVSDGAKSDLGNFPELFSKDARVLLPDPVYPAYLDTNLLAGRRISFLNATEENGFLPMPNGERADIIYLCSPNNPTGAAYTKEQLSEWVNFAKKSGAVIVYDAAYEAFLSDPTLARSIFQAEGARECAVEICSFSKTAGFTGVRCGYTVVPHELRRDGLSLHRLWARRQAAKFNGTSYVTQRGAAAVFSEEGKKQTADDIAFYKENARRLSETLSRLGIWNMSGQSPYVWMKCPYGMDSRSFFGYLLEHAGVVGTPGSGFGKNGEGYFRLSAFGTERDTQEACRRLTALLRA